MNEVAWRRLLDRIQNGLVVPVVGPRILVEADGRTSLQRRIAQSLLSDYGVQIADPLPRFREVNEAVSYIIGQDKSGATLQDLYADVHMTLEKAMRESNYLVPEPIRQITEIADFRLFVTLTPDDLIARGLRRRCAVNEVIHSPALPSTEETDLPGDWAQRPGETYLLYLFGKSRPAPMFAIHDEDVLEYAYNLIARDRYVPKTFLEALQQRYLLLIGCNFPEWLSRFFLRTTSPNRLSQLTTRSELLIEQLQPDESLTLFLERHSKETEILSDIPPVEFVAELNRRWKEEHGADDPAIDPDKKKETVPQGAMFFISYSRRTDLSRAESLYRVLLDLGVSEGELWFDRHAIEPGQDFRQQILASIRSCRYFLPLLSEAANDRKEAFVFDEWQEANQRQRSMNCDFIFPVIVEPEYEPERYTAKPVQYGEWARLDFGHAPEGIPDGRMTAKLRKLVRDARRPGHGE